MGIAAGIAGAAAIGGIATIAGASKAASAETSAANQATGIEQQQLNLDSQEYQQNRADLAPYREAGYTALGQLSSGTAAGGEFNTNYTSQDFATDPGYQFRLDQGNKAVQASAAAKGGVLSGGTLKALDAYNSGEASQEYNDAYSRYQTDLTGRYNRLASVAGLGQTATNTGVAASESNTATQTAGTNQIASNTLAAGNANASSYVAAGNAVSGAANSLGSYYTLSNLGGAGNFNLPANFSSYSPDVTGYTGNSDYSAG